MTVTLTALDAAWLYLEAPNRPMNVSQLLLVDPSGRPEGRPGRGAVEALVAGRLALLPRLRQRVSLPGGPAEPPVWEDDPSFDLGAHVHEVAVPAPCGAAELAAVASGIHVRPLDLRRPLWDIHLLQAGPGATLGILMRWHHALADALAGLAMARRLLQTGSSAPAEAALEWAPRRRPAQRKGAADECGATESVDGTGIPAAQTGPGLLRQLRDVAPGTLREDLRSAYTALERLMVTALPSAGPLRRQASSARRVAFGTIRFAEARRTRVALGAGMTELFLSLVGGALERLFAARGVTASSLRVMVPLVARGRPRPESGNHTSYGFMDLPVGPLAEMDRLRLVSDRLTAARASAGPDDGMDAAHLIVTHLTGPVGAVDIAGARLLSAHSLVSTGSIPLGVAIVSMGDMIGVTFTGDAKQFPDIDRLALGFDASYAELGTTVDGGSAPAPSSRRASGRCVPGEP